MKSKKVSKKDKAEQGLSKIIKPRKGEKKKSKLKKKAWEKVSVPEEDVSLLDPETVQIKDKVATGKQVPIPKIRRAANSENVEENYMIVPWASREEWDKVCLLFHEKSYKEVIAKIAVWQRRVPTLPVGVEATLFLLEALMYDQKLGGSSGKNYTEDQARSLYSLAIIRYLNHVSQLASQSLGGPSKKLTRELAAIVDTPEWLVALRNDVSHGPSAPSIEVLRMGGEFVLQWLKEKYWKLPEDFVTSPVSSNDPFVIVPSNENDEVNVSSIITELLAAYIAARIYKMRKQKSITDPEILRYVTSELTPVKSKVTVMTLKNHLREYFSRHPSLFTTIVSQELIPNLEFFEDFKSVVKCTGENSREDVAFDKLHTLWMPIIKLLESKGRLVSILTNLAEVVVNPEFEKMWTMAARWLDKLLELVENSGKKYSKQLVSILEIVIKHPNYSVHHFLDRLFHLTEPRLGSDAIHKLTYLVSIWVEELQESKKKRKEVKLFTIEDIDEVGVSAHDYQHHHNGDASFNNSENTSSAWSLDDRSEDFWRTVPLGRVF